MCSSQSGFESKLLAHFKRNSKNEVIETLNTEYPTVSFNSPKLDASLWMRLGTSQFVLVIMSMSLVEASLEAKIWGSQRQQWR